MAGLRVWGARLPFAAIIIVALVSRSAQGMSAPVRQETVKPLSQGADSPANSEPGADREAVDREEAASDAELRKRVALAAFNEARRLFLLEHFVAAARQFRRSYDTLPSLEALLAAALAYDRAGAIFEAIDAYEEYLEFEDEDVARHAKAVRRLEELRGKLGVVVLRIAKPKQIAELILNGEVVTAEDFPRKVLPGQVSLVVRHVGVEALQEIDSAVGSGETTVIEVLPRPPDEPPSLKPEESPSSADLVGPPPPAVVDRRTFRTVLLIGGGLTGAAGITIAVLGGLTIRQARVYRAGLCAQVDGACMVGSTYPYAAEESFLRLRRATNVAVGVGLGLAVTTLVVATIVYKGRARGGANMARLRWRGPGFRFVF